MLALLDRCAARDAWDIAHLPKPAVVVIQKPEFRAHFIAFAATLERPLPTYTYNRVQTLITGQVIADQLVPMLSSSLAMSPDELAGKSWARASSLLSLQNHEAEYINAIHRGELRLDLLFPNDAAEAARLARHPALLWKLENVRSYRSRKNPRLKAVKTRTDGNGR
jgi:hypothetical protein